MNSIDKTDKNESNVIPDGSKILLAILPYWDPMIPPMGITSLKTFLQSHGYKVRTEDLIVKQECLDFYNNYFE
ncbi:MAG: hypothetical protein GY950_18290, partial [bacterium]|nr:hypothetical protein [bacterium]